MEQKIHLINQIDLSKIIYSKVNEMNDKKLIHIYYEKPGNKLLFQTPQLLNIFDIQKSKYFNELIVPLYDCNLKVPLFIQLLKDLDSKIIEGAKLNKNEWFKNKASIRYKSLIKNLYTANTQTSHYSPSKDDEKYSTNGLIKLKITNGVKIIENNMDIKIEQLVKNNHLRLIIELYGIWVSNDVFGIYLKPVMVEQIENKVMHFIDEKEDITEVNYLETEANSDDEYIGDNELMLLSKKSVEKKKDASLSATEDSLANDKIENIENTKMFQFGLHDINEDLFNKLKEDKKIISILSDLNSNNTKKDIGLSDMSSDIDEKEAKEKNIKNIKDEDNKNDKEEGVEDEDEDEDEEDEDEAEDAEDESEQSDEDSNEISDDEIDLSEDDENIKGSDTSEDQPIMNKSLVKGI
jgi:CRISPR/Cas system-associated endoribonuclease Cas2